MSAAPELDAATDRCFHCDTPLAVAPTDAVYDETADGGPRGFCCHGCLGATQLIEELGLQDYYTSRETPHRDLRPPDPERVADFARFDDPALQRQFAVAGPDGDLEVTLSVGGMRCAACSWLLEERVGRLPGIRAAHFGLSNRRGRVRLDPRTLPVSELLARIAELGYRALPFEPDADEALLRDERRAALRRLGLAGLGTMQVMMFSAGLYAGVFADLEDGYRDLLRWASWLVATPVLLWSGWPLLAGAGRDLRTRRIGPDVPIALALVIAYAASIRATLLGIGDVYFDSVCMFVFFITLGRTLEQELRARSELRIRGLQRRVPEVAHRMDTDGVHDVALDALRPGDHIEIRPGEAVPADGLVMEGEGRVSESLLTGEPSPVPKAPGQTVLAGSQSAEGRLLVRVERTGPSSTLRQIAALLDRAQLEKPPIAQLADRVARAFVSAVVVIALGAAATWWWLDPSRVIPVVVAVLIATCPCALSLATPAALASATHGLAARGFLIARGHVLEALARVTRVVFDKTGTLTATTPSLRNVRVLRAGFDADLALQWAAGLERGSAHPIARALRVAAGLEGEDPTQSAIAPATTPGAGVAGTRDGRALRLGRADWALELAGVGDRPGNLGDDELGDGDVVLADASGPIAAFVLDGEGAGGLRPGAVAVNAWLAARGTARSLLSGDPSDERVRSVARRLRLDEARAGASPSAKLGALEGWLAQGDVLMAVGDGVNDAPMLGRAQVSVAMGSGSDLARVNADAVLLDDRLPAVPLALAWAERTRRIVRQNFAWALAYNSAVLPLALVGWLPPYLAALGMSASSLLVVLNSLRLRRAPRIELAGEAVS